MTKILLASLGESPVVVPVMYRLLKDRENLKVDEVHVLVPQGGWVPTSYDLVEEALQAECPLQKLELPFEDANTQQNCLQFLQKLASYLKEQQHNEIYLSLAGGRKSMAALMAWIVPFFSNVKGLFHVLDPDAEQFPSVEEIVDYSVSKRQQLMYPSQEDLAKLSLIPIPFVQQQIDRELFARLHTLDEEQLQQLQDDAQDALTTYQQVMNNEPILDVQITQMATDQYRKLCKKDVNEAQSVRTQYFKKMRTATGVRALIHLRTDDVYDKSGPGIPHYLKSPRTMMRPVIYTIPNTHSERHEPLKQVVICALETKENDGEYRPLLKVTSDPHFSWQPISSIDALPQMSEDTTQEHILLVPLGTHPMIATQLYTLLTEKEGVPIEEVVLFYPELSETIYDGANLLHQVVREENRTTNKNIKLREVVIPGRGDIDSAEACLHYQQTLEDEIRRLQHDSHKKILLSLSGGRKGMAAMTLFAAQNLGLHYVYHTLIADEKLSEKIDQETNLAVLNDPKKTTRIERNDRLFLRSYDRSQFRLFRVPVLTKALFMES